MTTLEYVRDYYLPLIGIFPDTEIYKNLCGAVGSAEDKEDFAVAQKAIAQAFDDLTNFINQRSDPRVKSFDIINRYFNRLRYMLNEDFSLNLPYQYFH